MFRIQGKIKWGAKTEIGFLSKKCFQEKHKLSIKKMIYNTQIYIKICFSDHSGITTIADNNSTDTITFSLKWNFA